MRAYLLESDGHVITLRVPRQLGENEVRIGLAQNTAPSLDIRHYLSNRTTDVTQGRLPKKGT